MAVAALMVAAAGCGSDDDPPTSPEAGTSTTPSTSASSPAASTPPLSKMRFSARTYTCHPKAHTQVKGEWETKAPRFDVRPNATTTLALRNSAGHAQQQVVAAVYTQHGGHAYASAKLKGTHWAKVEFPGDFVSAQSKKHIGSYAKGVLTVVWVTARQHKFISCDGFATVGARKSTPHPTAKHHRTSSAKPSGSRSSTRRSAG